MLKKKKHYFQILYIIVVPLCPVSLKRFVFYKAPPSDKHSLLWLASWPSALWLAEHHKHESEIKVKVTWHTAKYGNPYSEFVLCILPIQSAHAQQWTHTENTHTHLEQWAAIYAAAPGEQLGVQCPAQRHRSRDIEGVESTGHSLPPPTIPAGPSLELTTFRLWVRLSTIRPQLPFVGNVIPFSIIMSFSF